MTVIKKYSQYALKILGLAVLNYVCASLGTLMAIKPGNITPIWPPAGFAYVALLLLGYRYSPGVWLGSFVFNLFFFYQTKHNFLVLDFICAWFIACGSTVQAVFGAAWAKRVTNFNPETWQHENFFKLLLIGGPFSCAIAATVGTFSMILTQGFAWQQFLNTWLTWWFGDSAGVLVIGGFLLGIVYQIRKDIPLKQMQAKNRFTRLMSLLLVTISLGGTLWIWYLLRNEAEQEDWKRFEKTTSKADLELKTRLSSYEGALYGALGFLQSSKHVERQEWKSYVDALAIQEHYPGILGIGYINYVKRSQLNRYLAFAKPYYGITFTQLQKKNSQHNDLFIIQFIEPFLANKKALGFDIGSELKRRIAAERACDTGLAIITAPIQLVQDHHAESGFLLLLPYYQKQLPLHTIFERRKALQGWVYAPFIGREIFKGIIDSPGVSFAVYDGRVLPQNLIYKDKNFETIERQIDYQKTSTFQFAGRTWIFVWRSTPFFPNDASQSEAGYILLLGLLVSLLLASLLISLNTSRERAFELVEKKTAEIEANSQLLKEYNDLLENELIVNKKKTQIIRDISRRNELILNTMTEGIFGFNSEGEVQFINPSGAALLGTTVEEVLKIKNPHYIFHHTHPDGRHYSISECPMKQAAEDGQYRKITNEIFWRMDGTSFRVEYTITPVFEEGIFEGLVIVFTDITEKLKQERLIEETSRRFEAIFHQSFQFIGLMTPEGILLEANQSALQACGFQEKDVINHYFWDTPWWNHSIALQQQLKSAVLKANRKELVRFEATHPLSDGGFIIVDFSLKPLLDEQGEVVLLIPEGRDITYIKEIEAAHRQTLEQLKELDRFRKNFVSTLTHDLRTPLIAQQRVLSSLQTEMESREDVATSELMKGLLQNNVDLLHMINNLLETFELEEGRVRLFIEDIDLYQLAQGCFDELESLLTAKAIILENHISPSFPKIKADTLLLKRLFQNLLGNAISNIPKNSKIIIEATQNDDEISISVTDNGPGISGELLPHLFTRYLSGASARKKIGSGLGLYICKMIIDLHGGAITVKANKPSGTIVCFMIPKEPSAI